MKNTCLKAAVIVAVLLCFLLNPLNGQAQGIPKADNSIHDRMYELVKKSEAVRLPDDITGYLNNINSNNPAKAKAIYRQTSVLKVLYNSSLPKSDLLFFADQLLKNQSTAITAIHTEIKKLQSSL